MYEKASHCISPLLILASESSSRAQLLGRLSEHVRAQLCVRPAAIDEHIHVRETPSSYVRRLARAKAEKLAKLHPRDFILGADSVVALGRRILGKPAGRSEAAGFLRLLGGRRHRSYTAICILSPNRRRVEKTVITRLKMRRLDTKEQNAYLDSEEWRGKAGGYALQGLAAAFFLSINGSPSSVAGLPLSQTLTALRGLGFPVFPTRSASEAQLAAPKQQVLSPTALQRTKDHERLAATTSQFTKCSKNACR